MWQRLYVIYDRRAEVSIGPVQAHTNDASAVRMFNDIARTPDTTVAQHIEDFDLVYVGEFNNETGELHATPNALQTYPIDDDSCVILRGATLHEVLSNGIPQGERSQPRPPQVIPA